MEDVISSMQFYFTLNIFSMSHMIYEDYRKSALKHLKTCEYMIDNLNTIAEDDKLDGLTKSEWKDHILRNIYYLCGYVIEGIVNYCIYKKLRFSNTANIKTFEEHNLRSFSSSFLLDTGVCFNRFQQGRKGIYYYSIHDHNFAKNMDVLKRIIPNIRTVDIVNNPKDMTNKSSILYYDWTVERRYQTDNTHFCPTIININEEEILNFFIFVREEIYIKMSIL